MRKLKVLESGGEKEVDALQSTLTIQVCFHHPAPLNFQEFEAANLAASLSQLESDKKVALDKQEVVLQEARSRYSFVVHEFETTVADLVERLATRIKDAFPDMNVSIYDVV